MRMVIRSLLFFAALAMLSNTFAQEGAPKAPPQPRPTPSPAAPAASSSPQQQQGQDDESITVTIRRVRLPITVLDKKGQPVSGLTSSDFLILEDKKQQQIETFADEKESVPIYVGVLMDTSSSTAGKLKFEQESAKNFMYSVVRLRKDRIAFVTFDDEVRLHQDFTDKLDLLDKAVDGVKKSGGHTSLYDAVWQLCDEKMRNVSGRRVLVVITDGTDTYSRATLRDAIDIAQRTETIIFGVSTKAGFSGTVPGVEAGQPASGADRDLVKLCEETGGAAFFTGDMLALERAFTKISKELHTQYIVTYKPTNDRYDGSYRQIEVKLANKRDGMKVRTKHGYTAVADTVRR